METRDILDNEGNVIGTLTLPEGTSEDIWEEKLGEYKKPTTPTPDQIIKKSLDNAESFGKSLVEEFKITNIKMGITQTGKTKAVADYCHWLDHYLSQGSLYAAIAQIDLMIADENRVNLDLEPFVTVDKLTSYKVRIQQYLGL